MSKLNKDVIIRFLSYLPITLILSGCAFASVNRPSIDLYNQNIVPKETIALNSSATLDIAKDALEGMGYEIQTINKDLRLVRTKPLSVIVPNVCDCGTWNGNTISGTANSMIIVKVVAASAESSTLTIEHECFVNFAGHNLYGITTRSESYQCASRGIIEKEFWYTLNRILSSRGVPQ